MTIGGLLMVARFDTAIKILEVFPLIERHKLSIEPVYADLGKKSFAFWKVTSYDGHISSCDRNLTEAINSCVNIIKGGN